MPPEHLKNEAHLQFFYLFVIVYKVKSSPYKLLLHEQIQKLNKKVLLIKVEGQKNLFSPKNDYLECQIHKIQQTKKYNSS